MLKIEHRDGIHLLSGSKTRLGAEVLGKKEKVFSRRQVKIGGGEWRGSQT
ncbi:MAG: hypothetical protein IPK53_17565 [bacterium]|nr:hypothetical protein [bacterium]